MALDTQMPAWLSERSQTAFESALNSSAQFGKSVGTLMGAASNWAFDNKSNESFFDEVGDARLEQEDPLGGLIKSQTRNAVMQSGLNLLSTQQKIDDQGMQLQLTKQSVQDSMDAKKDIGQYVSKWQTEGKSQPVWLLNNPLVSDNPQASQWWEKQSQAISMNQSRQDAVKLKQDNSKHALEIDKSNTAWMSGYSQASPDVRAQISELKQDAWETDMATGKKIPSIEASTILNQWRDSQGMPPWDASPEQIRAFTATKHETNLNTREGQREQGRIDLEKLKGQFSVDAKKVTKDQFVNKNIGIVMKQIYDAMPDKGTYDPQKAAQDASDALSSIYDGPKSKQDDSAPTSSSTDKDPLGLNLTQ